MHSLPLKFGCLARAVWSVGLALLVLAGQVGCAEGWKLDFSRGFSSNPFRPQGEEWTILGMEVRGPGCVEQAERVAASLRRTPGIKSKGVYVRHDENRSRVYYGRYFRRADKETGKLDMPEEMRTDRALIKDLTVDGSRFFVESRIMPFPTPDVGEPAWELRRNPGLYTLRIALFYNEPGFTERKKAAAAYCDELRSRGHEAYYRHGDITSEVYVGSFGEDALVEGRRSGVLVSLPGAEVQALQEKETFRYELWNLKTLSSKEGGKKVVRASRVVPVSDDEDDFGQF
jgi:hypothetical protein